MRDKILATDAGARFVRGDLHVHSFGGSYDVKDTSMTPEAIVARAVALGIQVVALTDHNAISNVGRFLVAGASHGGLLAVPGVELSCVEGHLLCYLRDERSLLSFFGGLSISPPAPRTGETHCNTSMVDCLNRLKELGGFALLAHVDLPAGLERRITTMTPQKVDIMCHPAVLGFEVSAWPNDIRYSKLDTDPGRAGLASTRADRLGGSSLAGLAVVVNSDAHTLAAFGRNQAGNERTTRYKLNEPSFDALRVALHDPGARIRVEDDLGAATTRVVGLAIEGGFLDGLTVRFSSNLTCFIGGRGTGKTTALSCAEVVQALDQDVTDDDHVLESDVGPSRLVVIAEDEHGAEYVIEKHKGSAAGAVDRLGNGVSPTLRVDVFRQAEAPQLAQRVKSDPRALLTHLDARMPEVAQLLAEDKRLRDEHRLASDKVAKCRDAVDALEKTVKIYTNAETQMRAAAKAEVTALAELEKRRSIAETGKRTIDALEAELARTLGDDRIGALLREYVDVLAETEPASAGQESSASAKDGDPASPSLGESLQALSAEINAAEVRMKMQGAALLQARSAELAQRERTLRDDIEAKKKELRDAKTPFDGEILRKLSQQASALPGKRTNLITAKKALAEATAAKNAVERKRRDTLGRLFTVRTAWATRVLQNIPKSDLTISLKYAEGRCAPAVENLIIDAMQWRTNQVPRARAIVSQLGALALVDAIDHQRADTLLQVKGTDGEALMSKGEAAAVLQRLIPIRDEIFRAEIGDLARLVVSREGGARRDFARLSIGQQQSVLLALLLADDAATGPLLLDQPEDNLDGEFVFKTVVPALRAAKERRQIVLVTHDPNICVLGDAEQIVVLKSASERSQAVAVGSIDAEAVQKRVCEVLEGTEEAFKLRAKMYRIAL